MGSVEAWEVWSHLSGNHETILWSEESSQISAGFGETSWLGGTGT